MNTDDTQKIYGAKYDETDEQTDEQTAEGEAFFDNVADAQDAAEAIAAEEEEVAVEEEVDWMEEEWERQAAFMKAAMRVA